MKLTMLGTGNALVTECYNTCFTLRDGDDVFLVDGGGGSEILHRLKLSGTDLAFVHTVFLTHRHIDHILGVLWVIRVICQRMKKGTYEGDLTVYAHDEGVDLLRRLSDMLLDGSQAREIGRRVHLVAVSDGETKSILGRPVTFFDIHSDKANQFGFTMRTEEGKFTCLGDEPYNEANRSYAEGSAWLLHEAFCLRSQADIFSPYEKHHSTAADAAGTAEKLHVGTLLLYHTEDKNLSRRKELYTKEAKLHFGGRVFVPDDMNTFNNR